MQISAERRLWLSVSSMRMQNWILSALESPDSR